ncbi:MAG: DmsC/YnfH family molybdoenzyme membrane anchor subunit [Candidatus Bipolaricaulia bacterium]
MIQSRPFEFMTRYTPQREWIEGRGVLLWLAFFFIELGAGMFFIASLFTSLWGMFIGWLICVLLGGGCHLLYLGRPLRFYRAFLRPQTSWISRGMIFIALFIVLGAAQMTLAYWSRSPLVLLVVVDIVALLVTVYGGFAMNYVNGIPLWNTALLPVLYVVAGLWGGAELALGVALAGGSLSRTGPGIEELIRILLAAFILIVAAYLISVRYGTKAGEISVKEIVVGRWWPLFWGVVVLLGIAFPLGVVVNGLIAGLEFTPAALLALSILFELLGDLSLRYLILRNGFYHPLTPISTVPSA